MTTQPPVVPANEKGQKWITDAALEMANSPSRWLTHKPLVEIISKHYLASDDAQRVASLEQKCAEYETQLEAWHSQFGTSQLSHAIARLEQAEKERDQLRSQLNAQNAAVAKLRETLEETLRVFHTLHGGDNETYREGKAALASSPATVASDEREDAMNEVIRAGKDLLEIVEGVRSERWAFGNQRFKDTEEWARFYVAACEWGRIERGEE